MEDGVMPDDAMESGSLRSGQGSGGKTVRSGRRRMLVRTLQVAVSSAIIVGVFDYAIPKIADYSTVWASISGLTLTQLLLLVAATAFNIATYWPQMTASMPGLTIGHTAVNNQSSTTVANTVPGGGFLANGITWGMYRPWGSTHAQMGRAALLS